MSSPSANSYGWARSSAGQLSMSRIEENFERDFNTVGYSQPTMTRLLSDREQWEEGEYYAEPQSPDRALLCAVYVRAKRDLQGLPPELWDSWREQCKQLRGEFETETRSAYLRKKAHEKAANARTRFRLAYEAHEWLFSDSTEVCSCLWIREQCDITEPLTLEYILNHPV